MITETDRIRHAISGFINSINHLQAVKQEPVSVDLKSLHAKVANVERGMYDNFIFMATWLNKAIYLMGRGEASSNE